MPLEAQRFWLMYRRPNGSFRPSRVLNEKEEQWPLMEFREHRDQHVRNKTTLMDIKLFLEVRIRIHFFLRMQLPRGTHAHASS